MVWAVNPSLEAIADENENAPYRRSAGGRVFVLLKLPSGPARTFTPRSSGVSFVRQHIDRFNSGRLREQVVRLFHQGGRDLPVQVRLPTVLAFCGVEDTEGRIVDLERVPRHREDFRLCKRDGRLKERTNLVDFIRLRIEAGE